jgi:hypothetical protein
MEEDSRISSRARLSALLFNGQAFRRRRYCRPESRLKIWICCLSWQLGVAMARLMRLQPRELADESPRISDFRPLYTRCSSWCLAAAEGDSTSLTCRKGR